MGCRTALFGLPWGVRRFYKIEDTEGIPFYDPPGPFTPLLLLLLECY